MLKPFDLQALYIFLCIKVALVTDPCSGSGHILIYLFEVLMQIYESQGWTQREAAQSIVQNNLYGLDIDDRAAQLAYFAVMMKARQYDRRFLERGIVPHVYGIQESNGINREQIKLFGKGMSTLEKNNAINQLNKMLDALHDAKEYGSILNVPELDWDLLKRYAAGIDDNAQITWESVGADDALETVRGLIDQAQAMAQKYHTVVTNPPYMGLRNMGVALFNKVMAEYPMTKQDLFGVFIERCIEGLTYNFGLTAMITQHVWMFTSGFEKYRIERISKTHTIDSLVHLGTRAFEEISGEVVQTCAFVIRRNRINSYSANYVRLINESTATQKEIAYLNGDMRFKQKDDVFSKIPGNPICYWFGKGLYKAFENNPLVGNISSTRQGLKTSDDKRFVRFFYEVSTEKIADFVATMEQANSSGKKWFWLNKGAQIRWYGNNSYLINWENDGKEVKDYATQIAGSYSKNITAIDAYFKPSISWAQIAISNPAFRIVPQGYIFASAGPSLFVNDERQRFYVIGLLNSVVTQKILSAINPTINFGVSDVLKVPFVYCEEKNDEIGILVDELVNHCKADWDSFETSWDFKRHPLVRDVTTVAESYALWKSECDNRYNQLIANEEKLNRIFIDIYGLQDELTPDVADNDVTVHKADIGHDVRSLISYAVGCMLGRYSLDVERLAFAGGNWDATKYSSFIPDADNCIPITDEPYFEDDIVGRFVSFIRTVYGEETLEENLDFIAKALGNKGNTSREVIRNYFLNDFIKDHIRIYQKRPIYWLFDSGKQNGFKALVYMHRWNADTVGNLRVEYLHRIQRIYEKEIERMQDIIDNSKNNREVNQASKRREKLVKQLKEARDYDAKIAHVALSRVEIDLDDGVKINYEKVQKGPDGKSLGILAKI